MFFHTSFSGPRSRPPAACSSIPVFVPKDKEHGRCRLRPTWPRVWRCITSLNYMECCKCKETLDLKVQASGIKQKCVVLTSGAPCHWYQCQIYISCFLFLLTLDLSFKQRSGSVTIEMPESWLKAHEHFDTHQTQLKPQTVQA